MLGIFLNLARSKLAFKQRFALGLSSFTFKSSFKSSLKSRMVFAFLVLVFFGVLFGNQVESVAEDLALPPETLTPASDNNLKNENQSDSVKLQEQKVQSTKAKEQKNKASVTAKDKATKAKETKTKETKDKGQKSLEMAKPASGTSKNKASESVTSTPAGEVQTKKTKIYGGAVGTKEPSINYPKVIVPQVPFPTLLSPQMPVVPGAQMPLMPSMPYIHGPYIQGPYIQGGQGLRATNKADNKQTWHNLEPGLDYAAFSFFPVELENLIFEEERLPQPINLSVLRFDPEYFEFQLCAAAESGLPLSLGQWADKYQLMAAINASMYLPDKKTSTGYLRQGEYINNNRPSGKFGAWFLADPDAIGMAAGLPKVTILDREVRNIDKIQKHYRLVIQNYRIIDQRGEILWPEAQRESAIAAVGITAQGHILFLHCQEPVKVWHFAKQLLRLPLQVRTVMYVEGGAQAGMLLRAGGVIFERYGWNPASLLIGTMYPLPNVLGVKRKNLDKKQGEN